MSGYLPPHTTGGQASEVYHPKYELKYPNIAGDGDETKVYPLYLPDGVVPTTKTLIGIGPESNGDFLIKVQPFGFGLWGWGDVLTYGWGPSNGYDQKLNEESIYGAWKHIFAKSSKPLLDTAEHYGYTDGYSEQMVGKFWSKDEKHGTKDGVDRDDLVFNTKFFPNPKRHPWKYPDMIPTAFNGSLERALVGRVDIYQLHGPSHLGFWPRLETICEGLVIAYKTGKCKAIGTCNLSFEQVRYVYSYLKKHDVPLVSNQVEFSLVRQDPWTTGLIEKCRKLGVATVAYSPIAVGRLSAKYSAENLPRGNRNFGHVAWHKIQPIVDELVRIGEKEGKTPTAVALNWVICKGAIPIPTVKNKEQVDDVMSALGWRLSKEDEERLDVLGLTNAWDWNLLKHFQNWWWQQG